MFVRDYARWKKQKKTEIARGWVEELRGEPYLKDLELKPQIIVQFIRCQERNFAKAHTRAIQIGLPPPQSPLPPQQDRTDSSIQFSIEALNPESFIDKNSATSVVTRICHYYDRLYYTLIPPCSSAHSVNPDRPALDTEITCTSPISFQPHEHPETASSSHTDEHSVCSSYEFADESQSGSRIGSSWSRQTSPASCDYLAKPSLDPDLAANPGLQPSTAMTPSTIKEHSLESERGTVPSEVVISNLAQRVDGVEGHPSHSTKVTKLTSSLQHLSLGPQSPHIDISSPLVTSNPILPGSPDNVIEEPGMAIESDAFTGKSGLKRRSCSTSNLCDAYTETRDVSSTFNLSSCEQSDKTPLSNSRTEEESSPLSHGVSDGSPDSVWSRQRSPDSNTPPDSVELSESNKTTTFSANTFCSSSLPPPSCGPQLLEMYRRESIGSDSETETATPNMYTSFRYLQTGEIQKSARYLPAISPVTGRTDATTLPFPFAPAPSLKRKREKSVDQLCMGNKRKMNSPQSAWQGQETKPPLATNVKDPSLQSSMKRWDSRRETRKQELESIMLAAQRHVRSQFISRSTITSKRVITPKNAGNNSDRLNTHSGRDLGLTTSEPAVVRFDFLLVELRRIRNSIITSHLDDQNLKHYVDAVNEIRREADFFLKSFSSEQSRYRSYLVSTSNQITALCNIRARLLSIGAVDDSSSRAHRRRKLLEHEDSRRALRSWLLAHEENPYPTLTEKRGLAKQSGLSVIAVTKWFLNARWRLQRGNAKHHPLDFH